MGQIYYKWIGSGERIFFEVRNFNGRLSCTCDTFKRTRTCVHTDDVANNMIYVEEEKIPEVNITQLNRESRETFYAASARYRALMYLMHNAKPTKCDCGREDIAVWKDADFRCLQCGEPIDAGLNREQIDCMQGLLDRTDSESEVMWNILEDLKLTCV